MNLLAVLLAAAAGPLWAGADPGGGGRGMRFPEDPELAPVLESIEGRMPAYEEAEAARIQVPGRTIELGPKAAMYRCWKLRLTGDNGKQAAYVLERLKSVQDAIKDTKGKLTKDLLELSAGAGPDERLRARIRERHAALEQLLKSYQDLIKSGGKADVIAFTPRGLLSDRPSITPRLRDDDYTMVYDDSSPECRR